MAFLSVIRRWALRDALSIREIVRRTGLSRNTIAKYLNAGTIEPRFTVPERPSKLDPFADKLAAWLKTDAGKSRKQRRTLKQFHADLVALGYAGSYNRVAAFARKWRADRQRDQHRQADCRRADPDQAGREGIDALFHHGARDQRPRRLRQRRDQPQQNGEGHGPAHGLETVAAAFARASQHCQTDARRT